MPTKIGTIGAGSWGTAVSLMLADKGEDVLVWAREEEVIDSINKFHENSLFLPNVKLPENLKATSSIENAIKGRDVVIVATPSQYMRSVLSQVSYLFQHGTFCLEQRTSQPTQRVL